MISAITRHVDSVDGASSPITPTTGIATTDWATTVESHHKYALLAPDNTETYGIVIGSGTTTPTNNDYKLETQITHGVGAGQLDYGAQSYTDVAIVGDNVDLVLTRAFYNGSGDIVTIKEIGIYVYGYSAGAGLKYFCIVRDVTSDTPVPDQETATVQYTLRTTI